MLFMEFTLEQILVAMALTILAGLSTAIGSVIAFLAEMTILEFFLLALVFLLE